MLMSDISCTTARQPVFKLDDWIYLPVYNRPSSNAFWIGPCQTIYSSQRLYSQGATIDLMDLWERPWLMQMVKVEKNATMGEVKKLYLKAFGLV